MVGSEQYRAKALEYRDLAGTSADADEKREYQKLQQKFAELADNDEWLAKHQKQTLHVADIAYFGEVEGGPFHRARAPATLSLRKKRNIFCDVSERP